MLELHDFKNDPAWTPEHIPFSEVTIENQIEEVRLQALVTNSDRRGDFTVLMSDIYDPNHQTPHVYLVNGATTSIRAWVYHKRQSDRLA